MEFITAKEQEMYRRIMIIALSVLMLGAFAPLVQAKPELHFLNNGLPVIIDHRPGNPLVAIRLGVRAGSARDGAAGAGLAHFSEHLLATPYVEFAKENGMSANASTGNDVVSYFIKGPSRRFADIMSAFGGSITKREFTDTLFENERRAVTEETSMRAGNPDIVMYEVLSREAYFEHPYGYPSAGELSLTPFVTKEQVSAYIRRAFITPNMVLVVSGGVSPDAILLAAKKELGSIPVGPYAPVILPEEQPRQFAHRVALTHERKDARIQIAFSGVRSGHTDMGSLDVLGMALSSVSDAPLRKRLVETGLASSASCENETPMGPGLFVCEASTNGEKLKEVELIILEVLQDVIRNGITQEDLDAVKKLIALGAEEEVRSVSSMAGSLANFWLSNRSLEGFERRNTTWYGDVTVASVQDVARRYLRTERSTTVTIAPPDKATSRDTAAYAQPEKVTRTVLEDNTVVILVPADGYSTGEMNVFFPLLPQDNKLLWPAFDLLPGVLKNLYSRTEKSDAWKDLKNSGIQFSFSTGVDGFSLHISDIPKTKEARVVELLFYLMQPEKLNDEVIAAAKESFLLAENESTEKAWTKASRVMKTHFFTNDHRYGAEPDLSAIKQVDATALEDALRILNNIVPIVTIGGAMELATVTSTWLTKTGGTVRVDERTRAQAPALVTNTGNFALTATAKTTKILYALRIPSLHANMRSTEAASMAIAALALDDRLERETREKSGLSYSQGAFFAQLLHASYLVLYVETSDASRSREVRDLMRTLVQEAAVTPISNEELARLKERKMTAFEMGEEKLKSRMDQAGGAELLHQRGDEYARLFSDANSKAEGGLITRLLSDALSRNLEASIVVTGSGK